jgi:hypothetical protein
VDRLVGEVMSQEPYKSARRVFWIMDNVACHAPTAVLNRQQLRITCILD